MNNIKVLVLYSYKGFQEGHRAIDLVPGEVLDWIQTSNPNNDSHWMLVKREKDTMAQAFFAPATHVRPLSTSSVEELEQIQNPTKSQNHSNPLLLHSSSENNAKSTKTIPIIVSPDDIPQPRIPRKKKNEIEETLKPKSVIDSLRPTAGNKFTSSSENLTDPKILKQFSASSENLINKQPINPPQPTNKIEPRPNVPAIPPKMILPQKTSIDDVECNSSHSSSFASTSGEEEEEDEPPEAPFNNQNSKWEKVLGDNGAMQFINKSTAETWFQATDEPSGRVYYYNAAKTQTLWCLDVDNKDEVLPMPPDHRQSSSSTTSSSFPLQTNASSMKCSTLPMKTTFPNPSDSSATSSLERKLQITHPLTVNRTVRGTSVHRTKITENGKKSKWINSYLLLTGPALRFYKDVKHAQSKPNEDYKKADLVLNTEDLYFEKLSKTEVTSRKHVIKVEDRSLSSTPLIYLLQFETAEMQEDWYKAFMLCKILVNENAYTKQSPLTLSKRSASKQTLNSSSEEKGKIVSSLKYFFVHRPTKETLEAKGIYKNETIFGSTLVQLCEHEKTKAPLFVTRCIEAIEKRGLTEVGIYRVNGNGARIQQLRFMVDQNNYDLNSSRWELEVLTGALKLFFRELKEPVIPMMFYQTIVDAVIDRNNEGKRFLEKRQKIVRQMLRDMQTVHSNTLQILFQHLHRVFQHSKQNQMQSRNIAVCFGPNLLWPAETVEPHALAASYSDRCAVVDYFIQETPNIFT